MHVFDIVAEQGFDPKKHVEKILGETGGGDYTVACWEPGQASPYHCHPDCTEIYFCFSGGGTMQTPDRLVDVTPGSFVVHPPGELHEYRNGPERTLLYRIRYGTDMKAHAIRWHGHPEWVQPEADKAYFAKHPVPAGV
jgi:mannose-6-phosphate isomerase-like protein (cupin superfamily)